MGIIEQTECQVDRTGRGRSSLPGVEL